MEKIIIKFCNLLDRFANYMDSVMFPKPKRKKKKCKSCHCDCHCEEDLHIHFDQQDLCACEGSEC